MLQKDRIVTFKRREKMFKKIILAVIMVFLIVGIGFAFQNEPEGFRELKWGDPPTEDMKVDGVSKGANIYRRIGDKMSIGNAKFYLLEYSFYKNQFMEIRGEFISNNNYNVLKTIFEENFGEPTEEKYYKLWWWGEKAVILLHYDTTMEFGYFVITGLQIWLEKNEANK